MQESLSQNDPSQEPGLPESFPPREICIAGTLSIAFGVYSAIQTIASFMAGSLSFNLGFVGIFIGGGILIGRASSRIWAMLFSGMGFVGTLIAGIVLMAKHFSGNEPLSDHDAIRTAIEISLILGCNLWVFILLLRKSQKEWFGSPKAPGDAVRNLAWSAGIISALFSIPLITLKWSTIKTFGQTYPVQVIVKPYDSVTGKGVQSISIGDSSIRHNPGSEKGLPNVRFRTSGDSIEGLRIHLSGVASQPLKLEIVSDGYHHKTITIDSSSENEIRVPLQPLHVTVEPE